MRYDHRHRPLRFVLIPLVLVLVLDVGIGLWIGHDVRAIARTAQDRFAGAPVNALTALAADDRVAYELRNRAIWALGQIGDDNALPVLERLHTGAPDDRCDSTVGLCQYGLRKAIDACRGGVNVAAWVWRRGYSV